MYVPDRGVYGTGFRGNAGVEARISGIPVGALYAGPAPGTGGLDHVNIRIPPDIAVRGYVAVTLVTAGRTSNPVYLWLR
jgi:uncharacterized protein (TIGR03437 family)